MCAALDSAGSAQVNTRGLQLPSTPGPGACRRASSVAGLCLLTLPRALSLLPALLSMKDNYLFLKEVKNLVEKTNCELKVCFQYMNRGDRWVQVRPPGAGRARLRTRQRRLRACTPAAAAPRGRLLSGHVCVCTGTSPRQAARCSLSEERTAGAAGTSARGEGRPRGRRPLCGAPHSSQEGASL